MVAIVCDATSNFSFCAALKISPKDQDALAAKVYLLIDLDKFQEALAVIEKAKLASKFDYEKVCAPTCDAEVSA